jgi:hypothetical protein
VGNDDASFSGDDSLLHTGVFRQLEIKLSTSFGDVSIAVVDEEGERVGVAEEKESRMMISSMHLLRPWYAER